MEILVIVAFIGLAYIARNGKTEQERTSAASKLGEWAARLFLRYFK